MLTTSIPDTIESGSGFIEIRQGLLTASGLDIDDGAGV